MHDEDYYKREEDRKWRDSVESRLVSLTSAQKVTDDQLDDLSSQLEDQDELLHGNRKERDTGIVGQLNSIESSIHEIKRELYPDALNKGGLVAEHNEMRRKILYGEQATVYKWQFWGMVLVAFISTVGLLIRSWPDVAAYWEKKPTDTVERMIYNTKHPRIKHVTTRIKEENE